MKVTVVVNKAGKVIAAYVPVASESGPGSHTEGGARVEFAPSEDQELMDLDLPDEDIPSVPPPDFIEVLQRQKDRQARGG
jgi:hypothetical protein